MNQRLEEFFARHRRAALALSGGLGSVCLLHLATRHHVSLRAYFLKSALCPASELHDAEQAALSAQVPLRVLNHDLLVYPEIAGHGPDFSYQYRLRLFKLIRRDALEDGFPELWEGSNQDDERACVPGLRAVEQLGVLSPLRTAGLSRADIREDARALKLDVTEKPAAMSLASRVMNNLPLNQRVLADIEHGEELIRSSGFKFARLNYYQDHLTIALPEQQLAEAGGRLEELRRSLGTVFPGLPLSLTAQENS